MSRGGSFWSKDSLITHILFELCLFRNLALCTFFLLTLYSRLILWHFAFLSDLFWKYYLENFWDLLSLMQVYLEVLFILKFRDVRYFIICSWLFLLAKSRAVSLSSVTILILAPRFKSIVTISSCPYWAKNVRALESGGFWNFSNVVQNYSVIQNE